MSLSLMKNKDELKSLRIPAHKYVKQEFHPDMDWIRVQHSSYSKSFTDCNPEFDELITKVCCLTYSSCISKEKLLKMVNFHDAFMYFDIYFFQKYKSDKDLIEFFDQLEAVLVKSQQIPEFGLGMRFERSLNEITADMTERQSKDLKKSLIDFLYAQKYVHCELGLKGKFIPIEDYFEVRGKEGAWFMVYLLIEYGLDLSFSEQIYDKLEIKQYMTELNRTLLSLGDGLDFKSKLGRNDISSHIRSYTELNSCPIQTSVDMNDKVIQNSMMKTKEIRDKALKSFKSSDMDRFFNTLFNLTHSLLQMYYDLLGYEVKDGFVYHKDWENLFN